MLFPSHHPDRYKGIKTVTLKDPMEWNISIDLNITFPPRYRVLLHPYPIEAVRSLTSVGHHQSFCPSLGTRGFKLYGRNGEAAHSRFRGLKRNLDSIPRWASMGRSGIPFDSSCRFCVLQIYRCLDSSGLRRWFSYRLERAVSSKWTNKQNASLLLRYDHLPPTLGLSESWMALIPALFREGLQRHQGIRRRRKHQRRRLILEDLQETTRRDRH